MRVDVAARAQSDLRSILSYLELEGFSGPSIRKNFLASFHRTCDLLITSPHIGRKDPAVPDRFASVAELRRFPVSEFPKYLILYTVANQIITVVRVLHGARHPSLRFTDRS